MGPAGIGRLRHHRAGVDADQGRRAPTTSSRWKGCRARCSPNTVRGDIIIKGGTGIDHGEVDRRRDPGRRGARQGERQLGERGIRITDTSGEITAESVNGAITMTGIESKSVDASTSNGNIIYEGKLVDGGRYTLRHAQRRSAARRCRRTPTRPSRSAPTTGSFQHRPAAPKDDSAARSIQRGRRVTMTLGNGSADVSWNRSVGRFGSGGGRFPVRRGRD